MVRFEIIPSAAHTTFVPHGASYIQEVTSKLTRRKNLANVNPIRTIASRARRRRKRASNGNEIEEQEVISQEFVEEVIQRAPGQFVVAEVEFEKEKQFEEEELAQVRT